ncbi:glutamate racemase [Roseateles sp. DAIF2]|uniref:glutamate racemase n=1 Tax=Roseateles sp. DAIF2 TaxID=2714952 RepID=UPI0018A2BB9B|nr:glutamate racemase [Roseateles sp. DAIF2]QPF74936.1 glutamate racemase [Roseateles sp. DAIF2]
MNRNSPLSPLPPCIGVFDSGVGGLTVLRELRRQLPSVPLRYIADTAYAPYGSHGSDYITERSLRLAGHLIAQGARLLVVACNTATAHAVGALRARWPELPIVGTEPGIKPAVAASRNGRIAVLATVATLASERYRDLLARHADGTQVLSQPCPGLVDLIEAGDLQSPSIDALIERFCAPLREAGVDTVLLGCTHYPLIQPRLQRALGEQVQLLNIETAVAQQSVRLWQALDLPTSEGANAPLHLATTGDAAALQRFVAEALGWTDLSVEALPDL